MIKESRKDALLEIGTEEIPFSYIESALKQIENLACKAFGVSELKYDAVRTYATPRRLVLIVENLAEKSDDKVENILGPSLKAAKDAYGRYTQLALGFASKNGVAPEKLAVKITEKGEYLFFVKKAKGERAEKLLARIFPDIIRNIYFSKTMAWEESGFKFARPIRNIIALYGKKVIKFKIADVISSNWTLGLHTYDARKIKIDLPENYLLIMKNKSIIVDQSERHEEIRKSIISVAERVGSIIPDEDLVNEINYLVEYPSAILCAFDKKYLDLPDEVITACMRKSQKCFAVNDKSGRFSNYFVSVKNGVSECQEISKEGYEKVVAARLADARFFYDNDLKKGLICNIEKLKGVVFHKEIGTIYEKIQRIKKIVFLLNEEFGMQIDAAGLEKAVMLSKADLVSEMVFEYPGLQGIIGRIYALKLGEKADIALSIEQHYWPLNASGQLPSNNIALLISLADKLDSLAANFSIGIEPSGSADPYGMRRAGTSFMRMAMEKLPDCDIEHIVKKTFDFLPENVKNNPKSKNAYERLISFFRQRIESILETEGYNLCVIKAVVSAQKDGNLKMLGLLRPKLDALRNAKQKRDFLSVAAVFKRINNIINQAKKQSMNIPCTVNENLLAEDAEKSVYAVAKKLKIEVENYVLNGEYGKVFDKVLEIKPLIDNFFEKVMVMTEDKALKLNRISLVSYIKSIFAEFADFSFLYQ